MSKREKKKLRKKLQELEQFSLEIMAKHDLLRIKELEFDKRMRNKALRMAEKRERELSYIR